MMGVMHDGSLHSQITYTLACGDLPLWGQFLRNVQEGDGWFILTTGIDQLSQTPTVLPIVDAQLGSICSTALGNTLSLENYSSLQVTSPAQENMRNL